MDLRILCINVDLSPDLGNGEFGASVKNKKYFQDKKKLVQNGKAQLNNILAICGSNSAVKIPLIIIQSNNTKTLIIILRIIFRTYFLGYEAEIVSLRLHANGLYVLQTVCRFCIPQKQSTFINDVKEMMDSLFCLRSICVRTQELYMDALKDHKKSMTEFTINTSNANTLTNDWIRPLWNPPSPPPPPPFITTSS
jgi:hypothetical protein